MALRSRATTSPCLPQSHSPRAPSLGASQPFAPFSCSWVRQPTPGFTLGTDVCEAQVSGEKMLWCVGMCRDLT